MKLIKPVDLFEQDLARIRRDKIGCFEYTKSDMRKIWWRGRMSLVTDINEKILKEER